MKIKKIMSNNLITIKSGQTILEAVKKMNVYNIGFMVVVENDVLKGVFTDRDALLSLVRGYNLNDKVDEIMKTEVITINNKTTDLEASELMGYHQIKRLVVVDDQFRPCGVLTLKDLACNTECESLALEALCEISQGLEPENFLYENDNSLDELE